MSMIKPMCFIQFSNFYLEFIYNFGLPFIELLKVLFLLNIRNKKRLYFNHIPTRGKQRLLYIKKQKLNKNKEGREK